MKMPMLNVAKSLRHNRLALACSLFLASGSVFAVSSTPGNLGSGLDVLVSERLQIIARQTPSAGLRMQADSYREIAFVNAEQQVKVYIHLRASGRGVAPQDLLPARASMTAVDRGYRNGVIEAWVTLDDVPALARDPRVSSVILAILPTLDVGAANSQGVVQHRVDQITQNGTGITIGAMSDSYNKTTAVTAAADVTSGDLPGVGNPLGNTMPVAVLDDPLAGTDEGRAMLQIIHDMAPKARLGFATASAGQVSFADNIRSLAGLPGGSHTQPGFAAHVIVDDLFYSDSPMFGTSLVGKAVNEVAAAGVSYFSSAGNRPAGQGYFATYKNVAPNLASALAGTNITPAVFSAAVPADLYAGGFHNFSPTGLDVAQLINRGASTGTANISFQWDDPFDVAPPTFTATPFFTSSGTATSTTVPVEIVLTPALIAGQRYRVNVTANASALDAVVSIVNPNGVVLLTQDTTLDEEVFFFADIAGSYTVRVTAFDSASTGAFNLSAHNASGTSGITTDFNLHFFTEAGVFIKSVAAKNSQTNQPLELAALTFSPSTATSKIQMVVTRASVPTALVPATKIRYVMTGLAGPDEYFDYDTPITFGHNHEPGCISVAAYSPFRPYLPEDFTSPGPSYIYFDSNATRLATPLIRQKPDVAAMDGGNNTFFGGDSTSDVDTQANFFGTSAAAPHAAAIAGLVLQSRGGPGSVTPTQMRTILQNAGQSHDLDPGFASGFARTSNGGKVTLTVRASAGNFNNTDARSLSTNDRSVFAVTYAGPGSVATLSINLAAANPTGGNDTAGNFPGLVWDERAYAYGSGASGFPFSVGSTFGGFAAANVTAAYSLAAPAPAVAAEWLQLDLTFAANSLTTGRKFTFGADRDEQRTQQVTAAVSALGNSGDLFGAAVNIPAGTVAPGGATFTGTMSDGSTFSGTFVNRIGKGYSPLDGYGFINAQNAVSLP